MPQAPRRGHVLPAQIIELSELDGKPVSWMQTARVGRFISTRYGRFKITNSDLTDAERNINEAGPETVPVDYDHLMMHISKPGDGIAAGWFQRAELRSDGKELWGLIGWTPRAAEHIKNGEYRYCSPVVEPNHQDNETGEKKGTRIMCAAITNMPFIKGMAPIQLSEGGEIALAETSLTERQQRVSAAFYAKYSGKTLSDYEDQQYIVEYFDDYIICRGKGKLWKLAYTIDDELNVAFPSEPVEVVINYAELSETQNMPDQKPPVENNNVLELREQLTTLDNTVKLLSERLEQSTKDAETERNKRIAIENQLREKEASTLVLSLIQAGKLAKKQEDWAKKYALSDPEGFNDFAKNLDPIVALRKEHGSGESDENADREADPVNKLFQLCNDYIEKNGGKEKVKWGDAMRAVSSEFPDLAMEYRKSFVVSGTPGVN
jgi:phage I-like protein